MRLPVEFYRRGDVTGLAQELLGKVLVTDLDGVVTEAVITETEAYAGAGDKASHAYGGRRTTRTEPMFGCGGAAYVYLCYGIHHLFNVVVGDAGEPLAILLRAGRALSGTETILARRGKDRLAPSILRGPGNLTRGMGITVAQTGASLIDGPVWIEDAGLAIREEDITAGPRVGVDYAEEDAALPYRYCLRPDMPQLAISAATRGDDYAAGR